MITTTKENQFREALLRIVRCCRRAKELSDIFSTEICQGKVNCFDDLYGNLMDCLYFLNDENTDELEKSQVYQIIRNDSFTDEEATDTLFKLILGKKEDFRENLVLR